MQDERKNIIGPAKKKLAIGLIVILSFLAVTNTVWAAPLKGYEALPVIATGNGTLRVAPGADIRFMIELKNIGQKTWVQEGPEFVSVYTYEPKYRKSIFQDETWYRSDQPARLEEKSVKPGQKGHIYFTFDAPEQAGVYREVFRLAAEDVAWIPGGEFAVVLEVKKEEAPAPTVEPEPNQADGLSATLLLRSAKKIVATGGEAVTFQVGIKNAGTKSWTRREITVPELQVAAAEADTYHNSWVSATRLAAKIDAPVAPGALDFMDFTFRAPRQKGNYVLRYQLAVDGATVPDFYIDIPVEVTSNAREAYEAPPRPGTEGNEQTIFKYETEPMLRVGVLIVDEETDWQVKVSCATDWELRDTNNALLGELKANQAVTAFYKNNYYHFNRGLGLEKSTFALRFVPKEANAVCKVENWDRSATRDYNYPDNTYRNVLELHYNDYKDRTWLINELPMEWYLKGLGETSNVSPLEYQKALITAARTYAFYHWIRNTKRVREFFHVTGYADDQVYHGFGQESRSPNIVRAVEETRGEIVTYNGEMAITPYFSRSDGRTRDWSEVWNGSVDWIKSVACPCDKSKGYALWGHGVGMSATEALCMARQEKTWEEILKYFYRGIELEQYWK